MVDNAIIEDFVDGSLKGYNARKLSINLISDSYDKIVTYAKTLDNHFLLYKFYPNLNGAAQMFGVEDNKDEADKRIYDKALDLIKDCDIEDMTRYKAK